ncbi:MAG: response regulator [Magnetococcales bacterium]|nr:response regulator [Magnetococcales bacterium]
MMSDCYVVLIVDDNDHNRFTLRTLLDRVPECRVLEAASGQEALAITIDQAVDLILLDVRMPVMDGFETARHLKMLERTREIPILFLTAVFRTEEFIRHGYELGAVDYLTKPIDNHLLLNRIRLYLRLFDRERKLARAVKELQEKDAALRQINRELESRVIERTRELEKRNAELLEAKGEAERYSQAKTNFLASMSHEIRTPMNVVLGLAEMLRETDLTPRQHEYVRIMHTSGKALLGVIDDILDFARIEEGRIVLNPTSCSIEKLVAETTDMMRIAAGSKGLEVALEVAGVMPATLLCDENRLRQVLLNLLGNALKFTQRGRIDVRLAWAPQEGSALLLSVRDTGIGIAPEQQGCIFDQFVQADAGITRQFGGTGLGLTISRCLVEMMGGRIWVESRPGEGSAFHFTLPFREAPGASSAPPAPPAASATVRQAGPLRILLAEDVEENRILIAAYLEKSGHGLVMVPDGAQAVERVMAERFDVVLMDIQMPVQDGYSATRRIRQWERDSGTPPVPIIALSAHAMEGEETRSREAGCDLYLSKPVGKKTLLAAMQRVRALHEVGG